MAGAAEVLSAPLIKSRDVPHIIQLAKLEKEKETRSVNLQGNELERKIGHFGTTRFLPLGGKAQ